MGNFFDPIFIIKVLGPLGIFAVVFIESGMFFGFFFPGDSLLFTAGLLATSGYFSFPYLVIGCTLTAFLGGMFGYFFGSQVGPSLFSKDDSFLFRKRHLNDAHLFYSRYGAKTVFFARFLPIVRTFVPILAGVGKMKYSTFLTFNFVGAVIWSLLLTGGGYYLGKIFPDVDKYILPIIALIVIISFSPTLFQIYKQKIAKQSGKE